MDPEQSIWCSAGELVAGYSSGELSPLDVTGAVLRRIEQQDKALNAFCLLDAQRALEQAESSAQRWAQGHPLGTLDGVPTSIKDMFLTAGWPTRRGSHGVDPDSVWDTDSPAVARLREHGVVLLGKTTTPELGWKAVTDSPLTGITRNPWHTDLTPGGSSGGSAAAVASGMGPLSLGTDGGGSVRIPASFTGVAGFKPTYGRVPLYPASPFGQLAHAGPMAGSVDDLAMMLDVLALPDPRDPTALTPLVFSYRDAVRRDVRGLTAAFSPDLGYVDVDPEVAMVVRDAVDRLDDAGLRVQLVDPGFRDPVDAFDTLWSAGAAKWLDSFPNDRAYELDPGLAGVWERGKKLTASDYLEANEQRMALGIHMGQFHLEHDVLITPTVPITPFAAGHDVPPDSVHRQWMDWAPFSYPFNLTQQPSASVPAGWTSGGLPVGIQVTGPRHSDDLVLAVCKLLEVVNPWRGERPDSSISG